MNTTDRAARVSDGITMVVVTVAFFGLLPPTVLNDAVSSLELSLSVLAIAAVSTLGRPGITVLNVALPVPLVLLLVVMTGSVLWSTATLNTVRDVLGFLCLVVAAWLLVQRSDTRVLIGGVIVAGLVVVGASIALYAVDPASAVQQSSGAFEGIYSNRNLLGFVMLQCLVAALAVAEGSPITRLGTLGAALLFFVVIIASESRTSLIAAVFVVAVWLMIVALRRSLLYLWAAAAVFVTGVLIALFNSAVILDILGKDETLNGRAEIWTALIAAMSESPVLGFGFLREWPGWSAQSLAVASEMDGLQVVHAHNELLSWWSGTGVLGVVAIVGLYAFVYVAGIRMLLVPVPVRSTWPILAIVMLNVHGLTSISETQPQGWFTLMLVVFVCVRAWRTDPVLPASLVWSMPERSRATTVRTESV